MYEDLDYQERAIHSVLKLFENIPIKESNEPNANNELMLNKQVLENNLKSIQEENHLQKSTFKEIENNALNIDVCMQTGTGKTYTFTKLMARLYQHFEQKVHKFIIVIPSLAIKAQLVDFLKSSRRHFEETLGVNFEIFVLESKKNNKNSKNFLSVELRNFIEKENDCNVLIINQGMLNSKSLEEECEGLFLSFNIFESIALIRPFIIMDEPHKFSQENVTYTNLMKFKPQALVRFGATFPYKNKKTKEIDYKNLVYHLSAREAFNRGLTKGVRGHVIDTCMASQKFKLKEIFDDYAVFDVINYLGNKTESKQEHIIPKLGKISDFVLEKINAKKTKIELNNGETYQKGDMIKGVNKDFCKGFLTKAIEEHLKIEYTLLVTRKDRIKPITLFFIDNINAYRNADYAWLKDLFEEILKEQITKIKKSKEVKENNFYYEFLEKSLKDISKTHGGYFCKDNGAKDEEIAKEIEEILRNKEALLSLDNTRRFIFSQWTLKEGWDNPNVFVICKMRSSGSEISKLQEVGRGLRLPVNEYQNRISNEEFFLEYIVGDDEKNFIKELKDEVEGVVNYSKLDDEVCQNIIQHYPDKTDDIIIFECFQNKIIDSIRALNIIDFEGLKELYPLAFKVNGGKIGSSNNTNKVKIRAHKYAELKALWEEINQKRFLIYHIKNEEKFLEIVKECFQNSHSKWKKTQLVSQASAYFGGEIKKYNKQELQQIKGMEYEGFLLKLAKKLSVKKSTLHKAFESLKTQKDFDLKDYLNDSNVVYIEKEFKRFLAYNDVNFEISYAKIEANVHPSAFSDNKGYALKEINVNNLGDLGEEAQESFLLEKVVSDSKIEKANISQIIEDKDFKIKVFSKIPKNSIKIPLAGGFSYSPDFMYVIEDKESKKELHCIIESKGKKDKHVLSKEEERKINQYAPKFFESLKNVSFKTQFEDTEITEILREVLNKKNS
ncbi:type III restriction-modification system endonuclease [Helicobacter cetorum]|uniref:type III restriction-modification system endonuclease n=1 Tax=Helicobacter cetorum TaxID=138563 RepID=UPI000CF0B5E9|nr:type III restriction-modification system endonuclease [Helicobacter cetorum]